MEQFKISMSAARVNAGFTQKELSKKMHISNNTLVAWENGKAIPSFASFKLYCELCSIPMDNVIMPKGLAES